MTLIASAIVDRGPGTQATIIAGIGRTTPARPIQFKPGQVATGWRGRDHPSGSRLGASDKPGGAPSRT